MMISTKGRYALRLLADLAGTEGESFIPLKEIAERQGISEKYLESIVKVLVRGGILAASRGKGGGYRLKVAPESCTVGRVLRITEGTLAPVSCLEGGDGCEKRDRCATIALWRGLDKVICDYLDGFTLADLVRDKGAGYDYFI